MLAVVDVMVSDTKVYIFAEILRNSVSLNMLPIYTRFLMPEDYGSIELLSMIIDSWNPEKNDRIKPESMIG